MKFATVENLKRLANQRYGELRRKDEEIAELKTKLETATKRACAAEIYGAEAFVALSVAREAFYKEQQRMACANWDTEEAVATLSIIDEALRKGGE